MRSTSTATALVAALAALLQACGGASTSTNTTAAPLSAGQVASPSAAPNATHNVGELQALMTAQPGNTGREAATKLMADDPMNLISIQAAGLLSNGVECSLGLGYFVPLAGG